MIAEIFAWLTLQYGTNEFLIGTTVPFLLAGLFYISRVWARGIYGYILRNFTASIRINHNTHYYRDINEFVFKNYIWGLFRRNFVLSYLFNKSQIAMTAGYGKSLAIINGNLGIVELTTEKSDSWSFKEYMTITVLTFQPNKAADQLFSDIQNHINKLEGGDEINIYRSILKERQHIGVKPKRPLSTVFLPQEIKDNVMNALIKFKNSEQAYIDKGIPWSMGIILHGPPGTGKTSFIHAIASELGRDIHYHTVGLLVNSEIDARKTILVLEDFNPSNFSYAFASKDDEENEQKTKKRKKNIKDTPSDLLNFLDGVLTPHGLITIATTNHIEQLSDAIMRPGRFDIIQEIPNMQEKEYKEMCKFYNTKPNKNFKPESGAKLMADIKTKWLSDQYDKE